MDEKKSRKGILGKALEVIGIENVPEKTEEKSSQKPNVATEKTIKLNTEAPKDTPKSETPVTLMPPEKGSGEVGLKASGPAGNTPSHPAPIIDQGEYERLKEKVRKNVNNSDTQAYFELIDMVGRFANLKMTPGQRIEAACAATDIDKKALQNAIATAESALAQEQKRAGTDITAKCGKVIEDYKAELELLNGEVEQMTLKLTELKAKRDKVQESVDSGQEKMGIELATLEKVCSDMMSEINEYKEKVVAEAKMGDPEERKG